MKTKLRHLVMSILMPTLLVGVGVKPSGAQVTLLPTDDAYVAENDPFDVKNDAALNARTELDNDRNDIIFLRFDTSELAEPVSRATLNLTWFRDTNVDHLALLVYGVNDLAFNETLWTEFDLTYETAPGLEPDGLTTIDEYNAGHTIEDTQDLFLDEVTFLGDRPLLDFPDEDFIEGQTVGFSSTELRDFVNDDTNDQITLLVLRDWNNSGTQMRFASKETIALETIVGDAEGQFSPTLVLEFGELLLGDFDQNGVLDVNDINALTRECASLDHRSAYDLNGDQRVDYDDIVIWVKDLANTWIGDANVDGEFNTQDFVQIFEAGRYELPVFADWSTGDWDGSGRFDTGDFVVAFGDGGYERGPRNATAAIPEPKGWLLFVLGLPVLLRYARGKNGDIPRFPAEMSILG